MDDLSTGCNKTCNKNGVCNVHDQICECFAGYRGKFCESTCDDSRYGQNCSGICGCLNNGTCDFVTGFCTCQEGYFGSDCEYTASSFVLKCMFLNYSVASINNLFFDFLNSTNQRAEILYLFPDWLDF
jgi:hypothetical protein